MVEFTKDDGSKVSIASDAVAAFEPLNWRNCKSIIFLKGMAGGEETISFNIREEYEAVKQAFISDAWERSNGRC